MFLKDSDSELLQYFCKKNQSTCTIGISGFVLEGFHNLRTKGEELDLQSISELCGKTLVCIYMFIILRLGCGLTFQLYINWT